MHSLRTTVSMGSSGLRPAQPQRVTFCIASRELSVQLDESDNHITVTEDAVLNQSLQNENMSKDKLNKDDNQELCTRQI